MAVFAACSIAAAVEVPPLVQTINAVGPKGAGHPAAIAALQQLGQADAAQIPEILAGMDGANRAVRQLVEGRRRSHRPAGT